MPSVDAFLDDLVADLRRRISLLDDCGDRRALEDAVTLLTDYRISGMDGPRFERLLKTLREGRSPVRLTVMKPEALAADLAQRWQQYLGRRHAAA
jgi:hypothetical protein